ncbi:type II toxin-antitoxin system RelE/ParE family toxin [Alkalimarinus coralli]|uniref:type II toxin-antitoxin system RelE/ParE family toxin n=1 Tax=Alkalimarinus coralli TaxID=2935863 RepID=UPI00202AC919|nr:type II toxin-antitoxin system RelE/ParE family toxin [Alkalimarinus coralli]
MPIKVLDQALEEAAEAAAWYEKECEGLGYDFYDAIEAAFDVIEDKLIPLSPMPNKINRIDLRRLILKRFPFDIVVLERHELTIIVAVAHQSRKPGYWRDRISP